MYQHKIRLWWWTGRCPGSYTGAFGLARFNGDPRMLAEEVAK
jgi:hypothetical protein